MDPTLGKIEEIEGPPVGLTTADADSFVASAYEAHHSEIFAFVARGARDPSAAEDLLQETFLRLTTEARAGRTPDHLRAWLFRTASNLVISRGRRRTTALIWLRRYGAAEHGSNVVESPEARVLQLERTGAMARALARLPSDARVALLLSSAGFSGQEIAASIGRSEGATRTLLSRARVSVRRCLSAEDGR
jgi:RNA polymerase sigma-70 factor (ECF subfamily)